MVKSFTLIQTVATAGLFSAVSFWYVVWIHDRQRNFPEGISIIYPKFSYEETLQPIELYVHLLDSQNLPYTKGVPQNCASRLCLMLHFHAPFAPPQYAPHII
ncbi:hypothetical protein R6Q59_015290 [Mikania micrantha]